MFGIEDFGILTAYLLTFTGLVFAIWYGISRWNKDEKL
jgi:hypothetical protein